MPAIRAAAPVKVGYLGPAGSWTHQASLEVFKNGETLVPLQRAELFKAYAEGRIDKACVPVTTSLVGATPYMDDVLALKDLVVEAEYPRMLGYSLLAKSGAKVDGIKAIMGHPVALDEVRPWLDREMPGVERRAMESGGAAVRAVAESETADVASVGPRIGADIYGLIALADGIEAGPHNVTRWWVLGRKPAQATGSDKTSLLVEVADAGFGVLIADLVKAGISILGIYERPSKQALDRHRYLIEVNGHATDQGIQGFMLNRSNVRLLGSYAKRY